LKDFAVCKKTKHFFVFFLYNLFFGTFQRKSGILIPDLYLYSIDIQTNIKLKFDKKIRGKVIDFLKGFLEFFWKLFLNWVGQAQFFWFGLDLVWPMNSGSPLFICNVNSHFAEQWRRGNEAKEEVGEGRLTYWRCWRCWWLSAAVLWRQMVFPTIERERPEREVTVILFSHVFLLSLLLCFSFFLVPLCSFVFLLFLLSFPLYYLFSFPLYYLFSFPLFLFCSFLYSFINSNLPLSVHLPYFLSLFVSVFQNNLPSLFFRLFPPL
jgi:hypothetical protein